MLACLWYTEANAIGYAKFRSRSHDAVIRVYDESATVMPSLLPEPTEPLNNASRAGHARNSRCFGVGFQMIGRSLFMPFFLTI
jgi:hypothetical protein